jgi:threonine dehydratase
MPTPSEQARALTPAAIHEAYELIKSYVHLTPLLTCKTLDQIASTPQTPEALAGTSFEGQTPAKPQIRFHFKCENLQRIGAFKARGAHHALLRLVQEQGEEEVKRRGVITHSSGMTIMTSLVSLALEVMFARLSAWTQYQLNRTG